MYLCVRERGRERYTHVTGKPISVGMFIYVCVYSGVQQHASVLCCLIIKVCQCVLAGFQTQC